ncbi:hypothetical protein LMG19146_00498 [Xanthomonas arboricola pv. fragariae]|nr:hypothetical protein LMG19146_00498 [Xanthomonas arboricola pv. fragariae]
MREGIPSNAPSRASALLQKREDTCGLFARDVVGAHPGARAFPVTQHRAQVRSYEKITPRAIKDLGTARKT